MQDHRYFLALVFLFLTVHPYVRGKEILKMGLQLGSRISLIILLICMGSLIALPMAIAFDLSTLEIFEASAETDDSTDQTESDEDFLFETLASGVIPYLVFSKLRLENLDFQTADIKPVSPPPKPI
jgi:hypothetical protein